MNHVQMPYLSSVPDKKQGEQNCYHILTVNDKHGIYIMSVSCLLQTARFT